MKTKNLKINKKKIGALILAAGLFIGGGITLTHNLLNRASANSVETSESQVESVPFTYFYKTGDYVFVSNGETIGYIKNENIDFTNIEMPNYKPEFYDMYVTTDNAGVYLLPGGNDYCHLLKKGDKVSVNAISDDGWAVINYYDDNNELKIGFVNRSFINWINPMSPEPVATEEPVQEETKVSIAVITGDKVNVRSSMETGTNNRIGYCNTGDKFTIIDKIGGWYLVDFYGNEGYISEKFVNVEEIEQEELQTTISSSEVIVAKITGNNVNIRSSTSTKSSSNIIGFCDMTDKFEIIEELGDWYKINYLGKVGYIHSDYVRKITVDREEFNIQKMVALKAYVPFYMENKDGVYCYLPENQNVLVLKKEGNLYKVMVDGVVGYVNVNDTKSLTNRCIVVDLSRQIIKVYHNGIEVFRCHTITGSRSMQSHMGCFTIGHHMEGYTFPSSGIYNEYWIQVDKNRGFHPADANAGHPWQPKSHFDAVAKDAYKHWAKGEGRTYPDEYGSHGCYNMMLKDIIILYDLCDVGDNVLIIGQNDLMKYNLLGSTDTFVMASDSDSNLYFISRSTGAVITVPYNIEESGMYVNNSINDDIPKIKTLG